MPELPEVETIVRGLRSKLLKRKIRSAAVFYQPILVAPKNKSLNKLLAGDKFTTVERHGKYIKLTTAKGLRLVVHLRMTGQLFLTDKKYRPDKHVHLIIDFAGGESLIYRDIRKFGRWIMVPADKDFMDYINAGTDALSLNEKQLKELITRYKNKKLKAFLLDQTAIAGIGNIYADEICFALGLDPEARIGRVKPKSLLSKIRAILVLAIKNKGTSVSDYITSTGAKGNFQNILNVYKQKVCRVCGGKIVRKQVAGRTSHVCPRCQRKR
jgi:formamidopyrimidine-DNA glycosylase